MTRKCTRGRLTPESLAGMAPIGYSGGLLRWRQGESAGEQAADLLSWLRVREVEALPFLAGYGAQRRELIVGFDALSGDAQAEGTGQCHDTLHDRGVLLVLAEPIHKAFVDLEGVDREALQIGQ